MCVSKISRVPVKTLVVRTLVVKTLVVKTLPVKPLSPILPELVGNCSKPWCVVDNLPLPSGGHDNPGLIITG
jgi:hypothetical protein